MISLHNISWHPHCAPKVEIPKPDIVSTHVVRKGESRTKSGTRLKISKNQHLYVNTKTMERKPSDKHRYTTLIGKPQPYI